MGHYLFPQRDLQEGKAGRRELDGKRAGWGTLGPVGTGKRFRRGSRGSKRELINEGLYSFFNPFSRRERSSHERNTFA